MIRTLCFAAITAISISGCSDPAPDGTTDAAANSESQITDSGATDSGGASERATGGGFVLNGENTAIQFVGTHVGDKPDPRKGGFNELSGSIAVDAGQVSSLTVEIDTASLYTEIDKLTNHLKSPDFFDVRQFPKASFESTNITAGGDGEVMVTGNFTLLGVTKEISFPATVSVADGDVTFESSFEIDRTEFGMDFGPDRIEKIVTMTVTVGR